MIVCACVVRVGAVLCIVSCIFYFVYLFIVYLFICLCKVFCFVLIFCQTFLQELRVVYVCCALVVVLSVRALLVRVCVKLVLCVWELCCVLSVVFFTLFIFSFFCLFCLCIFFLFCVNLFLSNFFARVARCVCVLCAACVCLFRARGSCVLYCQLHFLFCFIIFF